MINWQSVIFNSFWIVGLSLLLAAFSYSAWAASANNQALRLQLRQNSFMRWFWLAMALVCIGLAGTSGPIWETVVWLGFAIVALWSFLVSVRA